MKHTNKYLVPFIFLTISLSFICSICSCKNKKNQEVSDAIENKTIVSFYNLDQSIINNIQQVLQDHFLANNMDVTFNVIPDSDNPVNEIKKSKSSLIFTSAGNAQRLVTSKAKKTAGIKDSAFEELTLSARQKLVYNDSETLVKAFPVLSDNMELDVDLPYLRSSPQNSIEILSDLEKFAQFQKKSTINDVEYPIIFAGKDSVFFFDLLGALCEAIDGPEYYQEALEIMNSGKGKNIEDTVRKLIGNATSPMANTGLTLKRYFKNGLINPNSFNYTEEDVQAFTRENLSSAIFMTLSQHRKYPIDSIRRYGTAYIPSIVNTPDRTFTANMIYAIPMVKNQDVDFITDSLLTYDMQESFARSTGLAPVFKNSRVPDSQSDDARYWVAATNTPFAGLGHDTILSSAELDKLKDAVRGILLYE